MQLAGKICVVTGAAAAIGRTTAIEMAHQGATVVVSDVNDAAGEATADTIRSGGHDAIYVHADMQLEEDIRALMDTAGTTFGRIDVLFNNAGVHETAMSSETAVDTMPRTVWDKVLAINLTAVWLCTKYAVPHMRKAGGGAIINISSVGGLVGFPRGPAYSASKAGVINLTRCIAVDGAKDNIRANCVCPASIETDMVTKYIQSAADPEAIQRALVGSHLIKRLGTQEEVAKLVCFLASDDASFINGSAYLIDGGSLAWRGSD